MRRLFLILALVLPLPAAAQDISAEIAAGGLAATEARLAALPAPTDAERFALGGVRFLGAVEHALQQRYRFALSPGLSMVPVLRLPIPENPAPDPFEAGAIAAIFDGVARDAAAAAEALAPIPETSDFALAIRPADLWFDIDGDGKRSRGEGFYQVAGPVLFARTGFDPALMERLEIRFDVADSRWLAAYAEQIGAVGNAVLAYDPTAAIAEVMAVNASFAGINRDLAMLNALDMTFGRFADALAVADRALRQQPDPARGAAVHAGLGRMIAQNRAFWRLVRAETDNDREWIPNDAQVSAMGLRMPQGTGDVWLSVLSDAELMLEGRLLVPYWRLGDGAGLNLRRMLLEPRPVDVPAWIQGLAALPYAERGPRVSADNWRRFDQLMQGEGVLFAAWLN